MHGRTAPKHSLILRDILLIHSTMTRNNTNNNSPPLLSVYNTLAWS